MLDKIVAIVLFIVAFAILICIHEAGHLSMAKLFKVYCKEYSIGFGPAIYSKKRKGHETKFSIRAIPLGGYVSMYGEGMEEDPDFKDIPKERSLEGIKKWKKAIILSAGVILNAVLAFVLIFISNFAFPTIYCTRKTHVSENSLIAEKGIKDDDRIQFIYPSSYEEDGSISPFTYEFTDSEKVIHANSFFIVDSDAKVKFEGKSEAEEDHFVLTFMFTGNKSEPSFSEGLMIYRGISKSELSEKLSHETELKNDFIKWSSETGSPEFYPNFEGGAFVSDTSFSLITSLNFESQESAISLEIPVNSSKKGAKTVNTFTDIGLSFKREKKWLPAKTRMRNTFIDYGSASSAVFKGLGVLFTGGFKNLSGIVGIFDTSASLYSNYTFSTYLFFWGLISVNLAIFNLLPFPGLDGWQLLVTAIEGVSRKKIPAKAKTIMSLIGLGLLFALMILIVVFDVLRIVGV